MKIQSIPKQRRRGRGTSGLLSTSQPAAADSAPLARRTGRGALQVEAGALSSAAREVAALRAGLGVPDLSTGDEDRLVLQIDSQAVLLARALAPALRQAGKVEQAAGISSAHLESLTHRTHAMAALHEQAQALLSGVRDSRTVLGETGRKLRDELRTAARALLIKGTTTPELRERLRTTLSAVEAAEQRVAAGRRDLRAQTTRENERLAEAVRETESEELLLRTMLDLKGEREVDPSVVAAAAETYEQRAAER